MARLLTCVTLAACGCLLAVATVPGQTSLPPSRWSPVERAAAPLPSPALPRDSVAPSRGGSVLPTTSPEPAPAPARLLAPRKGPAAGALPRPVLPDVGNTLAPVLGALGLVLGIFFVFVWGARRAAPAGLGPLPHEAVEPLGTVVLVGRQQLQLLRLGGRLLLVSLAPGAVQTVAEISDPAEVEHLLALCRRQRPDSATAAFRQLLEQAASQPASGFVGAARPAARGGR